MFFRRNQHLLDSETGMCQDQNNTFNLGEIKVCLPLLKQILFTVYGVNFAQFDVRQIKFIRF